MIIDATVGSKAEKALDAISRGDIPEISCVMIDGQGVVSAAGTHRWQRSSEAFQGFLMINRDHQDSKKPFLNIIAG